MKNITQAFVVAGILAASVGTASAQSNFSYNGYTAPQGATTYQSTGGYPSYGGGQHTYSHGGFYYGGVGSSHRGGTYQNPATGNQYGTHR